ncbi:protein NRT1/ PTR FAMILY 1.2-like [Helianthus annuus]|uniref:protein NRT1/ PTR FAMILY 1.2-like n=1 Tax=Helianthus annuus TaxID=4232 RepID=UPI001652C198|nr:protein NRT1/ PTR FAMILY 1.2-like [Helianthus annuus]
MYAFILLHNMIIEDEGRAICDYDENASNGNSVLVSLEQQDINGLSLPNEAFEGITGQGLTSNMIFYLMEVYHMEVATGAIILSIWNSLSSGLSIVGGFISDSYLGRFRVIATGSLFSLVGVTFLWLTSIVPQLTPSSCQEPDTGCNPPTRTQLGFLYASFGLMSIGSACIGPCSIATLTGTMFRRRFPVVLLLLLWSTFKSPFSGLIQVLIVAFRNRKIHLLPDDCYNHSNSNEMDRVELT